MSGGREDRKDTAAERDVPLDYDDCDFVEEYIALKEAIRRKKKIADTGPQHHDCACEKIVLDHFDDQASYVSLDENEFSLRKSPLVPQNQASDREPAGPSETNAKHPANGSPEHELIGERDVRGSDRHVNVVKTCVRVGSLPSPNEKLFGGEKINANLKEQGVFGLPCQEKTETNPNNPKEMKIKDIVLTRNETSLLTEGGDFRDEGPSSAKEAHLLGTPVGSTVPLPGYLASGPDKENDVQSVGSCGAQTEPARLVQRKALVERMAISDTEDVSTDNDFIRVNIIDTRKTTFNVPKHSSEKKERSHKVYKNTGKKIKVNKHVIDRHCRILTSETLPAPPGYPGHCANENEGVQERENSLEDSTQPVVVAVVPDHDHTQEIEAGALADRAENESDSKFSTADAIVLITEVKRHIGNERPVDNEKPINRFVLGTKRPIIDINDIIEINDFRERDLYDKLQRRTTKGCFSACWVRVVNGLLICYRSKGANDSRFTEDSFPDPEDLSIFYEKKHAIDLSESRLLLSKEQKGPWLGFLCCCSAPLDSTKLIDITNAKIRRVTHEMPHYSIDLQDNGAFFTLRLRNLDFVFEFEENLYCFRAASIDTFLKWVLTYHLRRSRGICRIEKLVDEDG